MIGFAYGYEVQSENDKYIKLSEKNIISSSLGGTPGYFLGDNIPIRKSASFLLTLDI